MAVTEYKIVLGGSSNSLSANVAALVGYTPIGNIAIRGGQSLQAVGEGTYDAGTVEDYQIVIGNTAFDLESKVNDLLSADLQPVGGVIPRENTILQAMGKVTPAGGGGDVAWADVTGKPATFPPTIGTTATTAKAGNYAPAWGDVTAKPTTFPPIIGATATTALAGDTEIPIIPSTLPPTDNSVTNAKVAANAAIALSKLGNVAAGTDGLVAGTLQATLQSLASRIAAVEP